MNQDKTWVELLQIAQSLLDDGARLILMAEEGLPVDSESLPYFLLRGHLKSIATVAGDVSILLRHCRYENIIGLARIAFESRVHLCATLATPEYAAEKVLAGIEEEIELVGQLLPIDSSIDSIQSRRLRDERSRLEGIRAQYKGIRRRKWKFKEAADAAGLISEYADRYSLLSHAAHCTPKGIASKNLFSLVTVSVIRLVNDLCATLEVILFQPNPKTGKKGPIIINSLDVLPDFLVFQSRCIELEESSREIIHGISFDE